MVFTCRRSPSVVSVVLKKAPLPCDDGSAGSPLGPSWHPMRRTPYIHSVSVFTDRRLGSTKRLGDWPRLLPWVDHPQNILSRPKGGAYMASSSHY